MARPTTWMVLAVVLAANAGCATSPAPMPGALPPAVSAVGTTASAAASVPGPDYRVAAGDVLEITVFDAPELSRSVGVSERGEVSLPLLGMVPVGGLGAQEIEALLGDRLRERYMRDPRVTVAVREVRSSPIYVMGEVNRPGAYPMDGTRRMTVLQAVSLGEGLRTMAAGKGALVLRTVVGGERIRIAVDLNSVLAGRAPDLELQPHDIVFIPTNTARSIGSGVLDAVLRLVTFRTIF